MDSNDSFVWLLSSTSINELNFYYIIIVVTIITTNTIMATTAFE